MSAQPEVRPDTVTLTIDGTDITVPKGTLVIRAAEQLGITVPRFCDHPLLDPLGACRQCMVEVEGQRKPFTACTTQCTDGMVVKTHLTSEVAADAQEAVLEFLLLNHPLDCPQCDKGGECPLQDQTLAHGPEHTRLLDAKRTYEKPIPISALIALDRERCVLCARCTRFSQEVSGDPFIELFERGALEQVAIFEDEPYESYFSGNVAQICPVGALTSIPYRFKARPFDLRSHPSVCNQCSAGCNLRVDVRRGVIERQLARDNMAVNLSWNCDRGRFAHEYVGADERFRLPMARNELGSLESVAWHVAVRRAAERLTAAGPNGVGILTGGRLTDEDSYALSRFARDAVGTDNVDFRLRPRTDEELDILAAVAGTVGPTYDEVEHARVVVVAGLDPAEEVPILFLRLRRAWRKRRQRIVVVGPLLGSLAGITSDWLPTAAGDEAQLLSALATGQGLDEAQQGVADALTTGAVVLAGERLALSPGALRAAVDLAAGKGVGFAWVPRRNNSRGAVDAGLVPGLLPGGRRLGDAGPLAQQWSRLPEQPGLDTRGILEAAANGDLKVLYLVGVDPARDFEDPALARAALERVETVIVQDLLPTDSSAHADIVLPACDAHERVGSFTTWEGRRQPFPQSAPAPGATQPDWDIFRQVAYAMGHDLAWETAADVRREAAPLMEVTEPALERLVPAPLPEVASSHPADDETLGVVVLDYLLGDDDTMLLDAKALQDTARRPAVDLHPADAQRLALADGASVELTGPDGAVALPVRLTDAIAQGSVVLPASSASVLGRLTYLRVTIAPLQGKAS
jgi:NADH-quinone oxidoreductase subunit G